MRSARRKFLGETIKTAAGIAGLITLAGCGEGEINATTGHTPSPVKPTTVPDNPPSSAVLSRADLPKNVLVILTDQERYPAHWPDGWVEKNLPSMQRLMQSGLTFTNAYTAAGQCGPSRAAMLTGQFSAVNEVSVTADPPNSLPSQSAVASLGGILMNESDMLAIWKGKWHLTAPLTTVADPSNPVDPSNWTASDIANLNSRYGWTGWLLPDSGTQIPSGKMSYMETAGGGIYNNDGRYVSGPTAGAVNQIQPVSGAEQQCVIDFLTNTAPKLDRPFCLVVALVNPHDVGAYPKSYSSLGYQYEDFANLGIQPPLSYSGDNLSTKPAVHQAYARFSAQAFGGSISAQQASDYANFYGYLHTVVDAQIGAILDALDAANLTNDTLIIRTADHGEAGLAHGGMTEKNYTAYEEMIHIPMVISNPKLYPNPQTQAAFYDHLNFLPTILDLAGVENPNSFGNGIGRSIVPLILGQAASVRDSALYTYDDNFHVATSPNIPGNIRAIRQGTWMYAVYFDKQSNGSDLQYEMYDLSSDPNQITNLLSGSPANASSLEAAIMQQWQKLHISLTQQFQAAGQLAAPFISFQWPTTPWII